MKRIVLFFVTLFLLLEVVSAEVTHIKVKQNTYEHDDLTDIKWICYSSDLDLIYEVKDFSLGFSELVVSLGTNYRILENNTLLHIDVKTMIQSFNKNYNTDSIAFAFSRNGKYVVANWYNKEKSNYTTVFWYLF